MRKKLPLPLVLVAVLFIGPVILAVLLYFGPMKLDGLDMLPNPDREFFAEPETLANVPLTTPAGEQTGGDWARYRWSLIYARISPCEGECIGHLQRLTQVYLALGSERERVQRVLLAVGSLDRFGSDPELLVGRLDAPASAVLVDLLGEERLRSGRFFVVDPLGNVILSYPPDADQRRLLKDLERLLDVSRVG